MKILTLTTLLILLFASSVHTGDFVSGYATCAASGNKQVSTTSYGLMQLTVSANITNTGNLYLGGSSVNTSSGGVLVPGASYNATRNSNSVNPASLYFACSSASDGLTWIGSR